MSKWKEGLYRQKDVYKRQILSRARVSKLQKRIKAANMWIHVTASNRNIFELSLVWTGIDECGLGGNVRMTYIIRCNNNGTVTINEDVYKELREKAANYEKLADIISRAIENWEESEEE